MYVTDNDYYMCLKCWKPFNLSGWIFMDNDTYTCPYTTDALQSNLTFPS